MPAHLQGRDGRAEDALRSASKKKAQRRKKKTNCLQGFINPRQQGKSEKFLRKKGEIRV